MRQALRPYPQFQGIDTAAGGGDHSGHSTYHAGMIRFEKRYSQRTPVPDLVCVLEVLTDADGYWPGGAAMDPYNRRLEKSIGQYDVTHNLKFSAVWDLPVGKGKPFLNMSGPANWVLGGWRVSGIAIYSSGHSERARHHATASRCSAAACGRSSAPTMAGSPRPRAISFDPAVDRTIQPASFFPAQPANTFGNMTRYNPKFRCVPESTTRTSRLSKIFRDPRTVARRLPRRDVQRLQPGPLRAGLADHSIADVRRSQPDGGRSDQLAAADATRAETVLLNEEKRMNHTISRRMRLNAAICARRRQRRKTGRRGAHRRGNALVSRSRAGLRKSIHSLAREDSFRTDGMGRVRAGRGTGCQSSGEGVDRQIGDAVRGHRSVFASSRRSRHGAAGYSRQGVPGAGLSGPGRTDAPQGPRLYRFERRRHSAPSRSRRQNPPPATRARPIRTRCRRWSNNCRRIATSC